jgi:branched-chain amino acid transport system permease protein
VSDIVVLAATALSLGVVYALIAVSVTLVFNANGVVNFGGGHVAMVGGMLFGQLGGSVWRNAGVSVLVTAALGGLCYLLAIRTAAKRGASEMSLAIAALAFGLLLDGIVGLLWKGEVASGTPFLTGSFDLAGGSVSYYRVFVVVVGALVLGAVGLFMTRSITGKSMRATSFNGALARVYGIRVDRVVALAWILGGALCGVAGVLLTPLVAMNSALALVLIVKGFAAAIIGGIGSPGGAVVGAIAIAFAEAFFLRYVSTDYGTLFAFALLFFALAVRPQGLFGIRRVVERV